LTLLCKYCVFCDNCWRCVWKVLLCIWKYSILIITNPMIPMVFVYELILMYFVVDWCVQTVDCIITTDDVYQKVLLCTWKYSILILASSMVPMVFLYELILMCFALHCSCYNSVLYDCSWWSTRTVLLLAPKYSILSITNSTISMVFVYELILMVIRIKLLLTVIIE
jgi:hypothetical protein